MKPLIYYPTHQDKERAQNTIHKIINILNDNSIEFNAYVLQMLVEGFEETFKVDIKNSISIKMRGE